MAELDARRAQVLSNAAKTIQRRLRTHQARKYYLSLRMVTIYMQSVCRGNIFIMKYPKSFFKDASYPFSQLGFSSDRIM